MPHLNFVIVDPKPALCAVFHQYFEGLPHLEIVAARFEHLPVFDCMVSPANSFGLMDGGVDAAITDFFGVALMRRVQERILKEFRGEQNVGTSIIVETGHPKHPFIAHTPTMRSPMEISQTDNVYRATWAMLLAVHQHNLQQEQKIRVVACPAFGTGTGHVPFAEAARQMSMAYRNFLNPPQQISWDLAMDRQLAIRYGGDFGLHYPPETAKPKPVNATSP